MEELLMNRFVEIFGEKGTACYFAPGRINLIGEHTDYNGGHVFPAAITLGTFGVARKRDDQKIRMFSDNFKEVGLIEFSLEDLTYSDSDDWANYPKGVLNYLIESGHNIDSGLDVLFYGTIPNGAGLSSSASIELLMGTICNDLYALHCPMLELVQIGKKVENEFIGVNSGIMDQFAVEQYQALIGDPTLIKRARHAVTENERTLLAKQALTEGDLEEFGLLLNASHRSLKEDYEVTGIELDTLVACAQEQPGVLGARMTGAGFGGCSIALVPKQNIDAFIEAVGQSYQDKIGYAADFYPASIDDGARKLF